MSFGRGEAYNLFNRKQLEEYCDTLKSDIENLKKENEALKKENAELKECNKSVMKILDSIILKDWEQDNDN